MRAAAAEVSPAGEDPLLSVRGLSIAFSRGGGRGEEDIAVDRVSFSLARGRTLCLVGESGCGKSVTALSLLRLLPVPPARVLGGTVLFEGKDLMTLPEEAMRRIRGNRAGMIFQDPMTSLNPVMRVGVQMTEGLRLHQGLTAAEAHAAAVAMLGRVGIPDPESRARDFPHQLSGGMRQRVMIGMALACSPALLIADEPTTALDVTVQQQILGLMRALIADSGSALLLITHDFGVVAQIADAVAVMYAGRIVEEGPARAVLDAPAHPYTLGLLRSLPGLRAPKKRLEAIPGTVPDIRSRPAGCAFHPRCGKAFDRCALERPPFFPAGDDNRRARCWLLAGESRG